MFKSFKILQKTEKILVVLLGIVFLFSSYQIGFHFYNEHSENKPISGGIYIEGSVGKLGILNPLYVRQDTITHDVSQLIFSGLTKYDPKEGQIVSDLADYQISENKKEYTFTLKENLKWHDNTPVTSDDITFTFNEVIKNPDFDGLILNYNDYSGIKVIKTSDKEVKFLLENEDSFFLVKTLVGILPNHILGEVPTDLIKDHPFNQSPIGTGPFKLTSILPDQDHLEINLEKNENYYGQKPNINSIQFKLFEDFDRLKGHLSELDAVRNIPEDQTQFILTQNKLSLIRYHLPQYVATFINTQSPILKTTGVRLGLQLGTDKESLVSQINQESIIDTPLLEIDQKNWIHQYSVAKANGALFDAGWKIPNKEEIIDQIETEEIKEEIEEIEAEYILSPNNGKNWETSQSRITISGTIPEDTVAVYINDYKLQKYIPGNENWSYVADKNFDNLKVGKNTFDLYHETKDGEKNLIDSIVIEIKDETQIEEEKNSAILKQNEQAINLPIRQNESGETLKLKLITPTQPKVYSEVAKILQTQWRKLGVELEIKELSGDEFTNALLNREYDLLIFGQSLGYNLDAYPYWHSSQAKKGGYNLSEFKNFAVDSLLEKVRTEHSLESRRKSLNQVQEIISKEVPAVFLYRPTQYFGLSEKIQNVNFEKLSSTSDRFSTISEWYANSETKLKSNVGIFTFFNWIRKQF